MKIINCLIVLFITLLMTVAAVAQEEQDDVSKALDSTATQWSFQFAWQGTEWKEDGPSVNPRPQGHDNFVQARFVMPFVFDSFTLLPRFTLRHYENKNTGKSGIGNSELFGLIIPKKWDWGTGRVGIGPLWPGRRVGEHFWKLVLWCSSHPVLACD